MSLYAVIMAGGRGERLYPLSTPELPKQFLRLFGSRTMLQHTVDRIRPLVPGHQIIVVAGADHAGLVSEQLPDVPRENIIAEPLGRGTAACAALSALLVRERDRDATLLVLPADHQIREVGRFQQLLRQAIADASDRTHLLTFGIRPDRPETGYGYILALHPVAGSSGAVPTLKAERFVEKPDVATAMRYLSSGTYYWNSGMFVWHVDAILGAMERHMPQLTQALSCLTSAFGTPAFAEHFRRAYEALEPCSVDRGIMEKEDRVLLIPAEDIGWSDIGSWDTLRALLERVEKPWGHEHLWALNQHYAGKFLNIRAGECLSLQYHEAKDETIYVLRGKLRLLIGNDPADLKEMFLAPGMRVAIPPRTIHRMEAVEDTMLAEVSTPQIADVVRLEDRYGRG